MVCADVYIFFLVLVQGNSVCHEHLMRTKKSNKKVRTVHDYGYGFCFFVFRVYFYVNTA